ncbi:MAG: (Fe-S)-binding protein [Thermoplasmata archaeon]|nr:MAG: (Fe-S)-binding protein [Thermoplasmata archaeon]
MTDGYPPLILENKVYYCVECGKCSSICPMNRGEHGISPRKIVKKILENHEIEVIEDQWLYSCLICGLCDEVCPSMISFTSLIRELRHRALQSGNRTLCSKSGLLLQVGGMMTLPSLKQNRLDWLPKDIKISEKGDIMYFVGCLPYFDVIFKDIDPKTIDTAKGTLRILNATGIEPIVSNNERCCGHDQLWSGDTVEFENLVKLNVEHFKELGIKKLLVSCPECYETISRFYPKYIGELDFEVINTLDYISELIDEGKITMKIDEMKATYHDPCSLGRHLSIYESPRNVIANIENLSFIEMPQNKEAGPCCGVSAWITCDSNSKEMQMSRLKEAKSTGASKMITTCPKCLIHFLCTLKKRPEEEKNTIEIDVIDLSTLASKALEIPQGGGQ